MARLVNELVQLVKAGEMDDEDMAALEWLKRFIVEMYNLPERVAEVDKRITETLEQLREGLTRSIGARVFGWAWRRQLRSLRLETQDLLPAAWSEAFMEMVAPSGKELAEAALRRWLRRLKYCARGEPVPGTSEKPSPDMVERCKALLAAIDEARRLVETANLPYKLREALKIMYVGALANTMLNRVPDITSFIETVKQLQENMEEYVAEGLTRYGMLPSEKDVKRMVQLLRENPPRNLPLLWLATGTIVLPVAPSGVPA